ncbi:MAG: metal ABC transporter permease [Candidatus Nitrosopumilus limneticus]|nr:C permease component [Candidatus Nitrosopumilus limneticus]MDC4212291.1 metal ABC transporter permease [Candidatus Nitrosopumilus limneticus]MDC4213841.1 metal ABC transporter permease [Candidatus Nitrosopumilus limneticus]MDC4215860.1 metal ABC transporter permease [Candidatus Nitrosopumilus limneticus]MDC4217078.1 metal ABC transporter permease [Candidatus Nitrosopumilus limneticus]
MLLDVLSYGFMQKALIAGISVAIICSFMGTFLVLRRYALFGDGIAHVAFGGISVGLFLGVAPLWSAFVVSVLGGLGLQKLRSSTKISGDAAVAVILVSGLAVGVTLVSASGGFSVDLFSFLFGSILLISLEDTITIIGISAGIVVMLLVFQKQFLHISFNEEQAKVAGLNVTMLNYLFVVIAAVTVVTSMRLVGILLISALIVIPNLSAMLFGKGFKKTIVISVSMSVVSVVVGIFLSYYLNLAPSGMIVLIAVALLLGTLACRSLGLISKINIQEPSKISHNA